MCGIAGLLNLAGGVADESVVRRMAAVMHHRGPDDEGYFSSGPAAFGFKRLSIIDLNCGHQPLSTPDGRYTIVFNGEIYNYREVRGLLEADHAAQFRTNSDTEVIVQAYATWGPQCVERFNGMFAFGIWDEQDQSLFLARDRIGKKPLFYATANGDFVFGSEVKVILQHADLAVRVDRGALAEFLTYRYVADDTATLFSGVKCLPPATMMTVRPGATDPTPQPYWDYTFSEPANVDAGDLERRLEELLTDSVRLRMIADVPFGAFLSGGIDSSVIVALLSKLHPEPLKTFSVGFKTGFSEESYARTVAKQFGCDHEELTVGSDELIANIPRVLYARETPTSEPSDIPIFLLSEAARKKVTVVLSGEGSDEIFAGYPKYAFEHLYRSRLGYLAPNIVQGIARRLPYGLRNAQLALQCVSQKDKLEGYACWFGAFSHEERRKLLADDLLTQQPHNASRRFLSGKQFPASVDEMLYLDTKHWLPNNLLLRGDRMTMANSLELRCPFLDYRLVEFAAREVPLRMKVDGLHGKIILKNVAEKLLPRDIVHRKKWGFKVPIANWFQGPLRQSLEEIVLSPRALSRGYFQEQALREIVRLHVDGRVNYQKQLWALYQLELWHLMFVDKTLGPSDSLR